MGSNLDMSQPVHRMSPGGQTRPGNRRTLRLALGKLPLALVILLLAGLSPRISRAQPEINTRVRFEIQRTWNIIERATEQLGISIASRTGSLLDKAREINRQAESELALGNLKIALVRTMEARDLARRALEAAEIDVKAHESIRDLIESTKDEIDRVSPIVREGKELQARRLLDTGISQVQRAEDAYRDQDYRKAIRLAASARDLVQRALERAQGESGEAGARPVDIAIERTDALIDELRALIGEETNASAITLLDEAVTLQGKAKKLQLSQRPAMALRLTTQARQAALDGLLVLARNPSASDVERALAVVEQLANDLAPQILSSDSKDAHLLLDSARERQADARAELAKGDAAQAIESARIAERLLRRAAEAAGIR